IAGKTQQRAVVGFDADDGMALLFLHGEPGFEQGGRTRFVIEQRRGVENGFVEDRADLFGMSGVRAMNEAHQGSNRPLRSAIKVSSAAFSAFSFCLMLYRCVPTVRGLRNSVAAIRATDWPLARAMNTSNSRSVSTSTGFCEPVSCSTAIACASVGSM